MMQELTSGNTNNLNVHLFLFFSGASYGYLAILMFSGQMDIHRLLLTDSNGFEQFIPLNLCEKLKKQCRLPKTQL